MIAEIIFWVAILLIFHTYVFYPLLLSILAKGKTLATVEDSITYQPKVSVLMSVYNEEKVLEKKIKSVLNTKYPPGQIELVIGSDGSTDRTDAIIEDFILQGHPIIFKRFGGRNGKSNILNELAPMAGGTIFILTDANILFEENTIPALVKHFADPATGLVGANIINSGLSPDGISYQEEAYIKRENMIKYREGVLWGSMMGAFGACYAVRSELFSRIPSNFLMEDFFITLGVIKKGKRSVSDLDARAHEDVSNLVQEEFKRKIRISAGNFQNLFYFKSLLLNPFSGVGFSFWSHKVLRWFTPFFILVTLVCLLILQGQSTFYFILLIAHLFLLFSPVFDWVLGKLNIHNFAVRLVSYFYLMNLALVFGFIKYAKGIKSNAWNPTQRNIQS